MSFVSFVLLSAASVATLGFLFMLYAQRERRREAALQRAVARRRRS